MEPTKKSDMINKLLSQFTGRDRVETIRNNRCIACGKPVTEFRDQLSVREYRIGGMCQACQDLVWKRREE